MLAGYAKTQAEEEDEACEEFQCAQGGSARVVVGSR